MAVGVGGSQFSLEILPLLGHPCPSAQVNSVKRSQWFTEEYDDIERGRCRQACGKSWGGSVGVFVKTHV